MRKLVVILALVGAAAPLLVFQPALAHNPELIYGAYQVSYTLGFEDFPGPAGYVNVPLQPPVPVNDGASADNEVTSITNRDGVPHTFAECTSACETAAGVSDPAKARFKEISLPALSAASAADIASLNNSLEPATYVIMCNVHKWMRARLTVTGG